MAAAQVEGAEVKHNYAGNCWERIQSAAEDKRCIEHDEPRGNCPKCPRCYACQKMFVGRPVKS